MNLLDLDDKMLVHHTHEEDTEEDMPEERTETALADVILGVHKQLAGQPNQIRFDMQDEDLSMSPQNNKEQQIES